ncbi:rRNA maturation RNase YbeY [Deferribacter autotrophicus]|uniref:rRNA maturation RNase YbeY n=1 Tax=Deferribacter autotrophicus TaxID=500465 RepID=UPI001CAA8861|nr:rRNA maturation RNase YbeY [Deferribacter autotrophicus]
MRNEINLLIDDRVDSGFSEDFFEKITRKVLEMVGYSLDFAEISIVLCDNDEIREINKQFRGMDNPTDVLSFPMNEDEISDGMLGDIVISIDKAKEFSSEHGFPLDREVSFLYIHGLLHLLGFDHERSKQSEEEMFDLQEGILKSLINEKICS